jgi:hypothetical protein
MPLIFIQGASVKEKSQEVVPIQLGPTPGDILSVTAPLDNDQAVEPSTIKVRLAH